MGAAVGTRWCQGARLGRVLSLAAILLALGATSAAGLQATPLTSLENAAPELSAYGGYVVFSRLETSAAGWRLVAWHDGTIAPLNVPERAVPFDADVGPSPSGAPTVVFSKCSGPIPRG